MLDKKIIVGAFSFCEWVIMKFLEAKYKFKLTNGNILPKRLTFTIEVIYQQLKYRT